MSGGIRRVLNLGVYDALKHAYSLRRLDLSKMNFFHPTAEEVAAHGKMVPTLPPAKWRATNRKRICNTNLATAEAAPPKIDPPKTELVMRPPQLCSMGSHRFIHFFPTASESKVVLADRRNAMLRFDIVGGTRYLDTLPCLHGVKDMPVVISVPPTDLHLHDGEDTGDLYIMDGILHPDRAEAHPQFEAMVWRGHDPSVSSFRRSWYCDILPLPPWISHHTHAFGYGHALVGDSICFSISGAKGSGTYCFHITTREWSKAGDWHMPFYGKADYVPELGLWFGVSQNLPCAADLSGVVRGEEPPPEKMRIWARDDLPEEWQPDALLKPMVISLGSGRFIVVNFLDSMKFDKDWNEMTVDKEFAIFTGMEVAFSNGKGNRKNGSNGDGKDNGNHNSGTDGSNKDNGNHSSGTDGSGSEIANHNSGANGSGNENGCNHELKKNENGCNGRKGKGMMRGLRMIMHKSRRYMFNKQQRIQAVF